MSIQRKLTEKDEGRMFVQHSQQSQSAGIKKERIRNDYCRHCVDMEWLFDSILGSLSCTCIAENGSPALRSHHLIDHRKRRIPDSSLDNKGIPVAKLVHKRAVSENCTFSMLKALLTTEDGAQVECISPIPRNYLDRIGVLRSGREQAFASIISLISLSLQNKAFRIEDDYRIVKYQVSRRWMSLLEINDCVVSTAEVFVNKLNLESKMLPLDSQLYVAYVYFSLVCNLFATKFVSMAATIDRCKKLVPDTDANRKVVDEIAFIHSTFTNEPNYMICVGSFKFPWNDRLLSLLYRRRFQFECIYKVAEKREESIYDLYSESDLRAFGEMYSASLTTQDIVEFEDRHNANAYNNFSDFTFPHAPCFNGTACSGKSTVICKILQRVNQEIDKNAEIIKGGMLGAFTGRDSNQILALGYQYTLLATSRQCYTSIGDRCPFNNIIWRIILKMMDTRKNMIDILIRELKDISPYMLSLMRKEPIIVFIDTNVLENRDRMINRNLNGDAYRARIQNYVQAQNIVYATFAYLCCWPILNRGRELAPFSKTQGDIVEEIVFKKITDNVQYHKGCLPPKLYERHKLRFSGNIDLDDDFKVALDLKILK